LSYRNFHVAAGGARVSGDALGKPALCVAALGFVQSGRAAEPDMAAALGRGVDDEGVVLAGDGLCRGRGEVVEKDKGPLDIDSDI